MLVFVIGNDLPLGRAISARLRSRGVSVEGVDNARLLNGDPGDLEMWSQASAFFYAAELDEQSLLGELDQVRGLNQIYCQQIIDWVGRKSVPIIYPSSFEVFDGSQNIPYISETASQPINLKGEMKSQIERQLQACHDNTLILRLGWLLDESSDSWLGSVFKLLVSGDRVVGYKDVEISPTAIEDVARVVEAMIRQLHCEVEVPGIYHYAGAEAVTHEDLVRAILYQVLGQEASEDQVVSLSAAEQGLRLPMNGVLGCLKLRNTFGIKQLPWRRYLPGMIERKQDQLQLLVEEA